MNSCPLFMILIIFNWISIEFRIDDHDFNYFRLNFNQNLIEISSVLISQDLSIYLITIINFDKHDGSNTEYGVVHMRRFRVVKRLNLYSSFFLGRFLWMEVGRRWLRMQQGISPFVATGPKRNYGRQMEAIAVFVWYGAEYKHKTAYLTYCIRWNR